MNDPLFEETFQVRVGMDSSAGRGDEPREHRAASLVNADGELLERDSSRSLSTRSTSTTLSLMRNINSADALHGAYLEAFQRCPPLNAPMSMESRKQLLLEKLKLCEILCDFSDTRAEFLLKQAKRKALVEVVDCVAILSESHKDSMEAAVLLASDVVRAILKTAATNLFQVVDEFRDPGLTTILESDAVDVDVEPDEPVLDMAWPHLQLVYELLYRTVSCLAIPSKTLRKCLTSSFLNSLLMLSSKEDPRQREYVKTTLHKIYARVTVLRPVLRKAVMDRLLFFLYTPGAASLGVSELLEILGAIIHGFAVPLHEEHIKILRQCLLPLHSAPALWAFHMQLSFCVLQFAEKDSGVLQDCIVGLLRRWPSFHSRREALFVNELEELLELARPEDYEVFIEPLFFRIAECIRSPHFQVAERALFFWNNEYIVETMSIFSSQVIKKVYSALRQNIASHWNESVRSISNNVLELLEEMDSDAVELARNRFDAAERRHPSELKAKMRNERWRAFQQRASVPASKAKDNEKLTLWSEFTGERAASWLAIRPQESSYSDANAVAGTVYGVDTRDTEDHSKNMHMDIVADLMTVNNNQADTGLRPLSGFGSATGTPNSMSRTASEFLYDDDLLEGPEEVMR